VERILRQQAEARLAAEAERLEKEKALVDNSGCDASLASQYLSLRSHLWSLQRLERPPKP
jgi:hypothetical protein